MVKENIVVPEEILSFCCNGLQVPPARAVQLTPGSCWQLLTTAVPGGCQPVPGAALCPAPAPVAPAPHAFPVSIPGLLLATAGSGLFPQGAGFLPKNVETASAGKMSRESSGQAGCSLCSRRLWRSLRCWLVPQSLPASRNSSVVLV